MSGETDAIDPGGVHLAWDPELRLARMGFRPRANPGEAEARACVEALARWADHQPIRLLIDCGGLRDTQPGWRAVFAGFFRHQGKSTVTAWFGMSPLVSMMVQMFVRASGVKGRGFRSEAEARAWLGLPPEAESR